MTFEDNLAKLKIVLPEPKDPVGAYIAVKKIDQFWENLWLETLPG